MRRRGEIIIRGSPNGIYLLKHTNDLVLTAGLQHLSAESHARRADASAAWAVCYCALCCPWAGQEEGGPFLLHVVLLGGSDCTCETDTAIKL